MKTSITPYVHSWPAPAVLVGCGTVDKPNLITISWFGTVCSEPPHISVAIRPGRHSFELVKTSREFTVNLPTVDQLSAVKLCGERSGRDINKFEKLGLTAVACPPLTDAPMVDECFLSMGCRVKSEIPLGTHSLFIAEVISLYVDNQHLRSNRRPDPSAARQLVWLDQKYWGLTPLKD